MGLLNRSRCVLGSLKMPCPRRRPRDCRITHRISHLTDLGCSCPSAQSFSSKPPNVEVENEHNQAYMERTKTAQYQNKQPKIVRDIHTFLDQVDRQAFPSAMVAVQVKKLLIQLVNTRDPKTKQVKGPLAARLLKAANHDLDIQENNGQTGMDIASREMRSKLYQLTMEAWLGTTVADTKTKDPWDQAERLLMEILEDATIKNAEQRRFFTKSLHRNIPNINGAFALLVFTFCKNDRIRTSNKSQNQHLHLSDRTSQRIKALITKIQALWNNSNIKLLVSSPATDAILYYYYKTQQADEAHLLFQSTLPPTNKNQFLRPTLHGMNTVISAYAKEGNVEKAKGLIEQMLKASQASVELPCPNLVSFNALLDAIHRRGGRDAGVKAEEVLLWMESLSIPPDSVNLTTVISAWAKSEHPDAAERADTILRNNIKTQLSDKSTRGAAANVYTFSSVIAAWARSNDPSAPERAMSVARLMLDLYGHGGLPVDENPVHAFNSLFTTLGSLEPSKRRENLAEILQCMEQARVPVDAGTHASIMIGLMRGNDGDGPQRALDYFYELQDKQVAGNSAIPLNVITYNVALDALSKCNRNDAQTKAFEILQRMIDKKDPKPDNSTFNTVMKILSRSSLEDSAQRCEGILASLEEDRELQPSATSYSTCISAWGYTRAPERYDRIKQLLLRMEASYAAGNENAAPNIIVYNTVFIACCHGANERERALRCVLEAISHMRRTRGICPNRKTYPLIFRSIGLNTKPGAPRDSLVLDAFERCFEDDRVNSEVMEEIQHISPKLLEGVAGLDLAKPQGE